MTRGRNVKIMHEAGKLRNAGSESRAYLQALFNGVRTARLSSCIMLPFNINENYLHKFNDTRTDVPSAASVHNLVGFCPEWNILHGLNRMYRDNGRPERSRRNNN